MADMTEKGVKRSDINFIARKKNKQNTCSDSIDSICIFIVRPIDDGKTVVYHCGAMKENQ